MGFGIPVDESLSKASGITGASAWVPSYGCTKYLLHSHVDAAGGGPTATVALEGANHLDNGGTAVTPKQIAVTAALVAVGDTYTEITTFPYKFVRINVLTNTNITLVAKLTGTKGG